MRVFGSTGNVALCGGRKQRVGSGKAFKGGVDVGLKRVRKALDKGRQGGTLRCHCAGSHLA